MNRRDIVIGILILAFLVGMIYWRQTSKKEETETRVPETLSVEDVLEEKFKIEIPEDVEKVELKDISGGDSSGIATRKFESGKFSLTVLADLADPEGSSFYQGWLEKGEGENYSLFSLGKMSLAKGGYILNFESGTNYSDYQKVLVTLEKSLDKNPEKKILEGSF